MKPSREKMSTQVCWAEYGPLDATLIERDDHEIVVEYIDDDGYRYTILLSSDDGESFEGNYEFSQQGETRRGTVTCTKYVSSSSFLLQGIMIEAGWKYHWWVKRDN